jgi:hypothetical protein
MANRTKFQIQACRYPVKCLRYSKVSYVLGTATVLRSGLMPPVVPIEIPYGHSF